MEYWYALYTKPHNERPVQAFLNQRGIETFFPSVPSRRRTGRPAERAFFPCYLFARADLDLVGLWTLQYAPGMRGVVMFGGLPARVGDSLIEQLRKRLAASDIVDNYGTILEPGDCVVITDGPLIDVQAVFDQCLSPAGRVRVLIQLLKQWTKVELDADVLRKIDKFPQRRLANRSAG